MKFTQLTTNQPTLKTKNMKKTYLLILINLIFYAKVNSQINNFPRNAKPGKCYVRCFDYEKKVKWEQIDCSLAKKGKKSFKKTIENIEKLKTYQQKLIDLGYDLNVTGFPDDKTINAHNKYIAKKEKEIRKKRKKKTRAIKER
jgi:hypothetical protein